MLTVRNLIVVITAGAVFAAIYKIVAVGVDAGENYELIALFKLWLLLVLSYLFNKTMFAANIVRMKCDVIIKK